MISDYYYAMDISEKCDKDFYNMNRNYMHAFVYVGDFNKKNLNLNQIFDLILFMGFLLNMTNELDIFMDNINYI